ncbi:hypothetical protein [uncultured Pseudoalteromonas sp.]|uniref:hypothetical protein n=1 Tax=uncultured Pseudoalteromonas sp. TaxID=114053 RepID=UPI002593C6E7|nr:hypothetical protein [uncultured Pseudoalteromonas sp.]
MTELLSLKLFGHCSVEPFIEEDIDTQITPIDVCDDILTNPLNLSAQIDMAAATACVLSSESDISEPLTEPVSLIDINDSLALSESISSTDECHVNHTDHSFMLSDEGGIITFDDDHGATDWGFDDAGISDNTDF